MAETDKDDLISIIEEDDKDANFPDILPLLSVRDVVIFNDMLLPLFVGRKKSVRAVEEAVAKDGFLLIVTQKDPVIEDPKPDQIFTVGTVSRVMRIMKHPAGSIKSRGQGIASARVVKYVLKR